MIRDKDGPEGKFFFQCWGKGVENVVFMATASGRRLERGMADWVRLPDSERKPGAVKVDKITQSALPKLQMPPGGLVARGYIRGFLRTGDGHFDFERLLSVGGGRYESEPTRDHLWLTRDEWQALVPTAPLLTQTQPVPEAVADRITRYHLMVVPDCVTGFWPRDAVRTRTMSLHVEQSDDATIQMKLEGKVLLAYPANATIEASKDGFDARLIGRLTYDRIKKVFTTFNVVAFGSAWESNENRPRVNKEGRRWVGIAFELADPERPGLPPLTAPYFLLRNGNDYFGPVK